MEEAKVGIISEDQKFADAVLESWRRSRYVPQFAIAAAADDQAVARHAVVLADGLAGLSRLSAGVVLAIAITRDGDAVEGASAALSGREAAGGPQVVQIPRWTGWADEAAALAQQAVLRLESQAQLAEAKQRLREAERFAALGKFITEARHGLGNALTGVLGNSELLLLESEDCLPGPARQKVETVRQMSLKIHEIFHRFSSLDAELRRQAEPDSLGRPAPRQPDHLIAQGQSADARTKTKVSGR